MQNEKVGVDGFLGLLQSTEILWWYERMLSGQITA